ncbi:uncharacterized protein [Procambarus clarkii]|uniref:uncharacterized protein isoform X1 n=1 Tax=Procambarus clarkii TaxID=6728 RepID=UPI00374331C4
MCTSQVQHATLCQPRTRTALVWACVWVWAWLGVWGGCPKVCECFWRDGKQMVACRDAQFIDIPRGIESTTQVLDLSHNNLRILPRDSFVYTGLRSLQKVMLNHCNLILLEHGAFNGVENIMQLDLSNNHLRSVPSAALMDMLGLRELRIAHNALTSVSASAFTRTPHIVQLDLSHNQINTIEPGAIRNLTELEVLNLSYNKLISLNASELEPLVLLRVIRIDGNPWHCDCHLRSLRYWFHFRNMEASVPPSCSHPKWLMGQDWPLLAEEEFLCAPKVSAEAPRLLAAHGENVSLLCRVETEVEATVTWFMGDVPLYNDSELQRYFVVELMTSRNMSYVSNLTITDVVSEDQGTYRCVAENRAGLRETNFTLQVSHKAAEVRIANIDVSYIKEGLLGGFSILIFVLLLVCSIVYCKVRVSRGQRQDEDSVETAQSSRGSDCETPHKLAGYHMVPTSELDSSPCRQPPEPSWNVRHRRASGDFAPASVLDTNAADQRQEMPECPGAQAMASNAVSFVESPKLDVCGMHHATLDRAQWKDMVCNKDIFLHRVCSRSVSQVSLGSGKQYPDLLDLPHPQFGVQLQQQMQLQDGGQEMQQLSAASCSRPLHPCRRTYSDAGCRTGPPGSRDVVGHDTLHPLAQAILNSHGHTDCNRSSSALNLALSQAASNAYANAHLPVSGHPCLAAPHVLDVTHGQEMLQLNPAHRIEGAAGGVCSQHRTADPCHFEYHAAQLEKFLKEYRCLQEQLIHMKKSYEAHQRAGTVPTLDCCPPITGSSMGSSPAFPEGLPCCSCNLQVPCTQRSALQPLLGNFAETSLTEATAGVYMKDSVTTSSTGDFNDLPRPPVSSDSCVEAALAPGPSVVYVEAPMPPVVRYVDSPVPQIQVSGYTDPPTCPPEGAESPVHHSPARGSPSGKTSSRGPKEPLKSILKKSSDGGGRRRCDQWSRNACCDSQTPPYMASESHPPSEGYPAVDSYSPASQCSTAEHQYPTGEPHTTAELNTTTDSHPTNTTTTTPSQHSCYDS